MNCWDVFTSIAAALGGPVRVPGTMKPGPTVALANDRREISNAHQVVGRCGEGEHPPHPSQATVSRLAHQPHGLDPAKDLFHPFVLPLAESVAPCRVVRPSIALERLLVFWAT